jgi:pyridoxal phosphate enzyme (YggS family)
MDIKANIESIRERAAQALSGTGMTIDDITIIAVTKTINAEMIQKAVDLGITDIGENRVQELTKKFGVVNGDVRWHMIGSLQRNKVKHIIDKTALIHSLDSLRLAVEINKQAANINRIMPVLVQVNIGKEATKSGIYPEGINELIDGLTGFDNIKVLGLMAIPPNIPDKEQVRPFFAEMRNIFERLQKQRYPNIEMRYLSMGMTHDFEIALQEGANIIRIGTGLFGTRKKEER